MRTEQQIFEDLQKLCTSPGYVHALAYICFNDNFVWYSDSGISGNDLLKKHSRDRLIRAELTILVGLLIKQPIDSSFPTQEEYRQHVEQSYRLMNELHEAISPGIIANVDGSGPILPTPAGHRSQQR
jgi:hypothetical protein